MEDEEAGEVELDEIVGGEGGSREGSDDDLDDHHDEEEQADGELRHGYARALVKDVLSMACIAYEFYGAHREVYHGRVIEEIPMVRMLVER